MTVPPDTRLRTRTGSGDQLLAGVQRDVDASSGSGDLRIGNVGGAVRATAGSGDINVAGSGGGVEARSGSGNVIVNGAGTGRTGIGTGSGDVRVTGVQGPLSLHTASGNIEVEGTPAAPWNLAASSGDIRVVMSGDAGVRSRGLQLIRRIRVRRARSPSPDGCPAGRCGARCGAAARLWQSRQHPATSRSGKATTSAVCWPNRPDFGPSRALARNVLL